MEQTENNTLVWKTSESGPGKVLLLPNLIERSYCRYALLKRGSKALIYMQEITDSKTVYEVFLIKFEPEIYFPNGKYLPIREKWPNNNAFGVWAWTCSTLERAIIRFNLSEGINNE